MQAPVSKTHWKMREKVGEGSDVFNKSDTSCSSIKNVHKCFHPNFDHLCRLWKDFRAKGYRRIVFILNSIFSVGHRYVSSFQIESTHSSHLGTGKSWAPANIFACRRWWNTKEAKLSCTLLFFCTLNTCSGVSCFSNFYISCQNN